ADELPAQYLVVKLLKDETDDDKRTLVFEPHGARYEQLIANL
ncbi:MAG TPA: tRNA (adenosine(37)-N6)-threonylcarbamoyltransferase complex ATPase subunit type 1 TsaE, partial [Lactobacillus sp.]|nr:tRNA (adenosine(37)-N6)-threonylcarbamoyltransferase complex ATPase subunit type 1 TsaE [Lactobacillus sp.]